MKKRQNSHWPLMEVIIFLTILSMLLLWTVIFMAIELHNKNVLAETVVEAPVVSIDPCPAYTDVYILASEIPQTPSPTPSEAPMPQYGFTDADVYLLAQLLCGSKEIDGDGEYDIDFQKDVNYYEIGKVLSVVMNRVRSDLFPNTVYDVVMQENPRQFSVMPNNSMQTPSETALCTVKEWCAAYDLFDPGVQTCPEDHLYFSGNGVTNTTR